MVRTRFAPSPTGFLHIGGVRTALFNWLYARRHGGQFLLRIDDTDEQRNLEAALQPILDGFRWLGLNWDEGPEVGGPYGPYYQSQRGELYQAAAETLLEKGLAYRDFARPEELAEEREAAEKAGQPFLYSRKWMAETEAQAASFAAAGRSHVVRLKMPREGACRFHDSIRGDVEFAWGQEQDHVIQRGDGTCLYHLASVVDDQAFQISHVIRAVEHLSNTPRQIFIAEGLGYDLPQFAHLPYVAAPGGKQKLSKRKIGDYLKNRDFQQLYEHGAGIARQMGVAPDADQFNPVLVGFYSEVGYLPSALLNYLLLLGWSLDDRTEDFSLEQMIESFSLERVNQAPAAFDPAKLVAFEQRHMARLDDKKKTRLAVRMLQRAGWIADPPSCDTGPKVGSILQAAGDRFRVAGDILSYPEFFVADEQLQYDAKAVAKRLAKGDAAELLADYAKQAKELKEFPSAEEWETHLKTFLEQRERKIGDLIHAVRVAVTGKGVGVGMFETLAILGRDACLRRIALSMKNLGETAP